MSEQTRAERLAEYLENAGWTIQDEGGVCPHCHESQSHGKYCADCGKLLEVESRFEVLELLDDAIRYALNEKE